ncbi:hypothetical protein EDD21DRAFT_357859 [Dissophora ornata]|nr:hypothetical protein EDD21DRAFT_357859 [Dissophora ornata]
MSTNKRVTRSTSSGKKLTKNPTSKSLPEPKKVLWRESVGTLFAKEYFRSCSIPRSFNYPDYLEWTRQHSLSRVQAQQHWVNAISFMEQHDHPALKDASVKMKKDQYSAKHVKFENEFFPLMEADERLKAKRRDLLEEIDDLITNEQLSSSSAEPSTTLHIQATAKHAREEAANTVEEQPPRKVKFMEANLASQSSQSDGSFIGSEPSSARSSLNSTDFRFENHLMGPGTTSSRLKTPARLRILDVDVSQVLFDARRQVVAHQRNINNISDLL